MSDSIFLSQFCILTIIKRKLKMFLNCKTRNISQFGFIHFFSIKKKAMITLDAWIFNNFEKNSRTTRGTPKVLSKWWKEILYNETNSTDGMLKMSVFYALSAFPSCENRWPRILYLIFGNMKKSFCNKCELYTGWSNNKRMGLSALTVRWSSRAAVATRAGQ